jgi:[phosphatase 2A protein]-leucine-carboxy methyltransferase
VDLGYLDDPFAQSLTPSGGGPGSRRFPIINRGIVSTSLKNYGS